ncbi:putative signal transducing protein [Luteimonas sp. e5]
MRLVFSSARLENAEGVSRMLAEAGIETVLRNGRSYKGGYRRNVSYSQGTADASSRPSVWVVHADDLPEARRLLREAGLIDSERPAAGDSYLPMHLRPSAQPSPRRGSGPGRVRVLLLVGIGALIAAMVLRPTPREAPSPLRRATLPTAADTVPAPTIYRADMPSALAALLAARIAAEHGVHEACLRVDGAAPGDTVLAALAQLEQAPRILPPTDCSAADSPPARIDAGDYRTDGSGSGQARVRLQVDVAEHEQDLQVRREGFDWHVEGPAG